MRTPILLAVLTLLLARPARTQEEEPAPEASAADPAQNSNPAGALGDRANFVNGIMFVGFSPQDHANGGKGTPKYDAYNYLVQNRVNPNTNWAAGAAAGLNKQYPCKFWAYDGETLWYEDEDIHTAPPGHGAPGGAIPGAKGEFIWTGHDGYVPKGNPCGGPSGQVNPPTEGGGAKPPDKASPAPAPAPSGDLPPSSGGGTLYKAGDKMDLSEAVILNNPPDLASWKVSTQITLIRIGPNDIHVEFSKSAGAGRWPDITPPGWKGPLQYTLGMAEYIGGKWVASAPIQFWYGLAASGGPPGQIRKNWFYDAGRWGPLAARQPGVGEKVGFFVVAGNVRGVLDGSQSPVHERSNVVVVPMPGSAGKTYTFGQ
jgi:hypothetical protein